MLYLLPVPKMSVEKEGRFLFTNKSEIILSDTCNKKEFSYAKLLQRELKKVLVNTPKISKGKSMKKSILIEKSGNLDDEEYEIDINRDRIKISAKGTQGLLFGVQTVRQMIAQCGVSFPCVNIKDRPDIANRGFFHDVSRGRVPTLKSLKKLADTASYYKLNQLQLNVEHTFLFRDFSEVWRDDTPISGEEIMELDEYCKGLNIELIPSIATFGHLYKVLSTKTYEHLCELDGANTMKRGFINRQLHHTIDISNPASMKFVEKMLREYLPYFTSRYVNIGADETFDLGLGKSREMCENKGKSNVYVAYLNQVCGIVQNARRIPMYWGDVLLENPEYIKKLPRDGICLNWGYSDEVTEESTRRFSEVGAKQYSCCGVSAWNTFVPRVDYAYNNITKMCRYANKYKAAGIINTDWGDYGHINLPDLSLPAMIYGAMFSWNNQEMPYEDTNRMISVIAFGDKTQEIVSIVAGIANQSIFDWGDAVRFREARLDEGAAKWVAENMPIKKQFYDANKDKAVAANTVAKRLTHKLYTLLTAQGESYRYLTRQYILMAGAVPIFNNIAAFIEKVDHASDVCMDMTAGETAVALEYWWKDYKEFWCEQSKHSELAMLEETIFWFCDYLRER